MEACHWKADNSFTNFYLKDLTWSDNDNNMYLGPAVVGQQVLDPSPQTSYLRKDKKRGGTPATAKSSGVPSLQPSLQGYPRYSQVFRSLIPGLRYWLPAQDVMVKSCIYYYCI